jgi:YVTN family beta-propeller protein
MPLALLPTPDGRALVLLGSGWRAQGVQLVDRASGAVTQTVAQPSGFVGLAFAPTADAGGAHTLYASGGNGDVVYRYCYAGGRLALVDSLVLAARPTPRAAGTRYPAGLALSPDGRRLYVAENLADSLAVVDVTAGQVVQRLAVGRYPYGVAVAPDGRVFVSAWGGQTVSVFAPGTRGGRSPACATSRWPDTPGPSSSTPPGAGCSSPRGAPTAWWCSIWPRSPPPPPLLDPAAGARRRAAGTAPGWQHAGGARPVRRRAAPLRGRERQQRRGHLRARRAPAAACSAAPRWAGTPRRWPCSATACTWPTARGAAPRPTPTGPQPAESRERQGSPANTTLRQIGGTLTALPAAALGAGPALDALGARVARANGWDRPRPAAGPYPPFRHVVYVIKENRTYDQVFGDLAAGDGDTSLVFFPRAVSPNHHALAERFGLYDRFFVNAEVSPDGHNWSTAAYTTDYLQKTAPSHYSDRGRTYDYEGTNRSAFGSSAIPDDDVAEPANGYLWDLARRAGATFRNYGEFVVPPDARGPLPAGYRGNKPFLRAHTSPDFAGYDLSVSDQRRADVWIRELGEFARSGQMPALQVVRLPNDHTAGARRGSPTPRAYMADNDLALGRMVEALSRSPFWRETVMFVLEDDAQNGPDHVDSHRAPFLVVSAWNRPGLVRRFVNTTDVLATIEEILGFGTLSQFDYYGRPLRDVWAPRADARPYAALVPAVPLTERNTALNTTPADARASARLALEIEDQADEEIFNQVLWRTVRGPAVPYPGTRRLTGHELALLAAER